MSTPAKLLLLVNTLRVGGSERNVTLLCRSIDLNRFRPEVWILQGGGEFEQPVRDSGVTIRNLHRRWPYDPFFAWRTAREIAKADFDLVHAFLPTVAAYVGLGRAMAGLRQPTVLSMGQSSLLPIHKLVMRKMFRCFDEVVVNSPSARECALSVGFHPQHVHLIPNGHNADAYRQSGDRECLRQSLGVRPEELMLLTIGRLVDTKRVCDAVDAAALLAGEWPIKLVIVGEGPELPALRRQAAALDLENRVVFTGQRTDVPALLHAADLFVFPSETEGLPNSLIEAALSALPIVACTAPGVTDVVCDGENARLVPPRSPAALSAAIRELLADPVEAERLAQAAQFHAMRTYTVEQWLDRLYNVYERLIRPGRQRAAEHMVNVGLPGRSFRQSTGSRQQSLPER